MNWEIYNKKLDDAQAIVQTALGENRTITAEERTQIDAFKTEAAGIKATLEEMEELEALGKTLEDPTTRPIQAKANAPLPPVHNVAPTPLDDGGFTNLGELAYAVLKGDKTGRLQELRNTMVGTEDAGAGGYPLPPRFVDQILSESVQGTFVRDYAVVIPPDPARPDAGLIMPKIDQSAGPFGGVAVDWVATEGGQKPETGLAFGTEEWKPNELAAWIPVSDKALRNVSSMDTIVREMLAKAYLKKEDDAFVFGDGADKPQGFLNATTNTAIVKVNRAAAGAVSYTDLVNMMAHMTAEEFSVAVWVIDRKDLPLIATIQDVGGSYIYVRNSIADKMQDTLLGRPIIWRDQSVGLALVNLRTYIIQDGTSMRIASSEHVLFTKNQTILKIYGYTDGRTWVKSPITQDNGEKTSPYIVLDAPAGP